MNATKQPKNSTTDTSASLLRLFKKLTALVKESTSSSIEHSLDQSKTAPLALNTYSSSQEIANQIQEIVTIIHLLRRTMLMDVMIEDHEW